MPRIRTPRLVLVLVACLAAVSGLAAPSVASARALPGLPPEAVRALRAHMSSRTLARLPELSPVVRALGRGGASDGEHVPTGRCAETLIVVFAAGDGTIDRSNTGAMRVSCVTYDPATGRVRIDGAGLGRTRFVDLASVGNDYVANVPAVANEDGTALEFSARSEICSTRPAGSTFAPYITYLGIEGGYLAIIGHSYSVTC